MAAVNPNNIASAAGKIAGGAILAGSVLGGGKDQERAGKLAALAGAVSVGAGVFARLSNAGLQAGGSATVAPTDTASYGSSSINADDDWRVRISVGERSGIFYKNASSGILTPLAGTNGVVFPYTPQISINYQNNYASQSVTHNLQPVRAYQNSEVSSISITGEFTAQTPEEANYVLAALHFFKSASKMFFGQADNKNNIGAPPPVLFLNGMGQHYFPNVTVLLTSFVHTMADDVDFTIAGWDNQTRVPTTSSISLTLVPQYSRTRLASFNLDAFARGELINGKGNFI